MYFYQLGNSGGTNSSHTLTRFGTALFKIYHSTAFPSIQATGCHIHILSTKAYLQLLLQEVLRGMVRLEIDVNVCPLHIRQALKLNLQFFRYIVCAPQGIIWIHDDVNFDD